MTGQAILLLSDHASYMTGQEYFVDGYVDQKSFLGWFFWSVVNRSGRKKTGFIMDMSIMIILVSERES